VLFVHKFVLRKNRLLNVFADYVVLNRTAHSHVTRCNNDLRPLLLIKIMVKSLNRKATILWNRLPNAYNISIKKFLLKIKSFFLLSASTYCWNQ